MRFKVMPLEEKYKRSHRWFTIFPIKIDNEWIWLEWVKWGWVLIYDTYYWKFEKYD